LGLFVGVQSAFDEHVSDERADVHVAMRILIVSPHYSPEPFRTSDVARGLMARGHEVEVLTGLPHYPAGRFYPAYGLRGPYREVIDGVPVHRVPVVPRGAGGAARLLLNYASFALMASLKALFLGRRQWDVVFVFQLSPVTAALPATIIRRLFGVPVVLWVQDLWPESVASSGIGGSRPLYAVARALSAWIYRRCDHVLGTSRSFGERLQRLGVAPDRFEYLPQWAEELYAASHAGPTADGPAPWSGGFPVMFAGNIGRVQGLPTILRAAELTRGDPEIKWVFVGDGSAHGWLRAEVSNRRLDDRVFLVGRKPAQEMPGLFAQAGAMLVSLQRDDTMALTVPAKVQSYLAAGKPIVASIDGEAARVVTESGAGFAAPAEDADALAAIVRTMKALPPAELEALGARGRAFSAEHFGRARCLDQLERALADTAARLSSTRRGSRNPCS
jgi:colanic acid biosynthesis glycosyl transferase WcaI